MLQLMREANGVGLAAPQVGVSLRMFVCNHSGDPEDDMICINPELTAPTPPAVAEEGCLSIPEVTVAVRRPEAITITARTPTGDRFERSSSDLLARVWQHETDHLDGRLIIDFMSEADEIANRRAINHLKDMYRP
jgi:peptide deformylase